MEQNFSLKEDNMATRRKLTLVNGTIDQEGSILMYQTVKSVEVTAPLILFRSPLPFPDNDDDWDDFDQSE